MKNETIAFGDALNETLGNPTRIKTDNVSPETFKNFVIAGGASRAGKTTLVAEALQDKGIKMVADEADVTFDLTDVNTVVDQFKNPTREAYSGALEALARLEEQSIVSNVLAEKIKKDMKIKTNPNNYGSKLKRKDKLHKPSKFFGDSKKIIYVRGKDGEPKPMSIKNAKKRGYI